MQDRNWKHRQEQNGKVMMTDERTVYDMYYEYAESISKIPNHRVLAVNRGEKRKN